MGCFCSKVCDPDYTSQHGHRSSKEAPTKHFARPVWSSTEPCTPKKLQRMRDEYWHTQPHYGGDRVIWDAIKAALDAADMETTRVILEAAGIIVSKRDMTIMYDERGARYDLPPYVLAPPSNLTPDSDGSDSDEAAAVDAAASPPAVVSQQEPVRT